MDVPTLIVLLGSTTGIVWVCVALGLPLYDSIQQWRRRPNRGLSKVNGAFVLLFALIIFILLTIVPTMSILGSVPTPSAQISSSPSFLLGVLALLGITGYVLVKWRRAH